ncbi:MAG: DUF454 family protein [Pseudomonadales bacterium]|nr:DUF454 family protein [Pseudomonadales bacterium]
MSDATRLPLIPMALGRSVKRFRYLVVRPLSRWQKLVYGLAAAILIVLGLIGLVLPVLPGLVFLALAAGLLARVSPRFGLWWYQKPLVQRFTRKQQQLKDVLSGVWRRALRSGQAMVASAAQALLRATYRFAVVLGAWLGKKVRRFW